MSQQQLRPERVVAQDQVLGLKHPNSSSNGPLACPKAELAQRAQACAGGREEVLAVLLTRGHGRAADSHNRTLCGEKGVGFAATAKDEPLGFSQQILGVRVLQRTVLRHGNPPFQQVLS